MRIECSLRMCSFKKAWVRYTKEHKGHLKANDLKIDCRLLPLLLFVDDEEDETDDGDGCCCCWIDCMPALAMSAPLFWWKIDISLARCKNKANCSRLNNDCRASAVLGAVDNKCRASGWCCWGDDDLEPVGVTEPVKK